MIVGMGLMIATGYVLHLRAMYDLLHRSDTGFVRPEWILGMLGSVAVILSGLSPFVMPAVPRRHRALLNLIPPGNIRSLCANPFAAAFLSSLALWLVLLLLAIAIGGIGGSDFAKTPASPANTTLVKGIPIHVIE